MSTKTSCEKYYVTVLSNFARAYDKYSNCYSKHHIQARFPDQFFVLDREQLSIGIEKNKQLLQKNNDPRDQLLIMRTEINDTLYNDHATGIGHYVKRNYIELANCYLWQNDALQEIAIEDAMALSLSMQDLQAFSALKPRSVSVLPIAQGCQAACSFCFSKASVSEEFTGFAKNIDVLEQRLQLAKAAGAERAVITGGGEPTLLKHAALLQLIELMARYFDKVVLISNAYALSQLPDNERQACLAAYAAAGLSILAMSHHHHDDALNAEIMHLDIPIADVIHDVLQSGICPRLICVLQKGGIETARDIENYLSFAATHAIPQVCFKELYVSTSSESYYHNHQANLWSRAHQIPLARLVDYLESHNFERINELPWGSPIYRGIINGHSIDVAAYTEPSLFWERSNGVARSWNIMSDGSCLVSLEDKQSVLA